MKFKDEGSKFEPLEAGAEIAICIGMIDLGTTENTYNGKTSDKHQVLLIWEVPGQTEMRKIKDSDEEKEVTRTISKFYTMSLNEKANLRKDLESWRGKAFTAEELEGFEGKNLLEKGCMISIICEPNTKGDMKSKVSTVMALPKGIKAPAATHDIVYFSFDDNVDMDILSDGLKTMVMKSHEFKALNGDEPESGSVDDINDKLDEGAAEEADSDNIPF